MPYRLRLCKKHEKTLPFKQGRKVIYSSSEKSRLFIADEIISVSNPLVARKQ